MSHRSNSPQLDREIAEALAEPPVTGARDVTERLLGDASSGPGETVRLVATAKPARHIDGTPTLAAALEDLRARQDRTMGSVSKALAYSRAMPHGKRDHANLIRLIKGGHVHIFEVSGSPPSGSAAHGEAPHADRYYLLHVGPREAP